MHPDTSLDLRASRQSLARALSSLLLLVALAAPAAAQQVGPSQNVFPFWGPADQDNAAAWDVAWKYGDLYRQRQVEGSTATSALNPNHRLTCFIDYSSIDVATDLGAGDQLAKLLKPGSGAKAQKVNARRSEAKLPASYAGSCANGTTCEGWVRCSWTEDGGTTNTPFFLPGAPWDTSAIAQQMPYSGQVAGTTDPVVVSGPNGVFHVLYVAFTRGSINFIVDAVFTDVNTNEPGKHALQLERVTAIASGNNSKWGQLHDKEAALVRPCGGTGGVPSVPCPAGATYRLDVAYTLFTGNITGKFQAQIYNSTTFDDGRTFFTQKISSSVNEITGVALTGGKDGTLFAFFRDFSASPKMYMVRETSGVPPRARWTSPVSILDAEAPTLQGYNQVAWKTTNETTENRIAFANLAPRSNGFATAGTAPDGTVFAAWQECVNPATGRPASCTTGSPRIVLTGLPYGTTYGSTWSNRVAADNGPRQPEENGQGFFSAIGRDDWNAHPQLLPTLACGREGCLLTYFESRTNGLSPNAPRQIGGYDRLVDLRGVRLNSNGTINGRSFQISKYPYRPGTTLKDLDPTKGKAVVRPEEPNDIAMINEVCAPDAKGATVCTCVGGPDASPPLPGLTPGCIPQLNYYCRPQSGGGTTCFMGDYNGLAPKTQWIGSKSVLDTTLAATDVPSGFVSVSSTNQNLLPPDAPWTSQYAFFGPPNYSPGLPSCGEIHGYGSRNTDLVMSQVTFGLDVVPSVTAKRTPDDGCTTTTGVTTCTLYSFPFEIRNNTSQVMNAYVAIDYDGSAAGSKASFSKTKLITANVRTAPNPADATKVVIPIPINPGSSAVRVVYAKATGPIHVSVTADLCTGTTCTTDPTLTAGLWFNNVSGGTTTTTDPTPTLSVTDPVTLSPDNLSPDNLSPDNLSPDNLSPDNLSPDNLSPDNLSPDNLSPDNAGVVETTWVITSNGDPTKSFQALPYVDRSYSPYYFFQMQIYKVSPTGPCLDASGNATTSGYAGSLVANTGSVNLSPDNLSPDNLSPDNLSPDNLALADAFPEGTLKNNVFFTSKPRKRNAPPFDPSDETTFESCTTLPAPIGECLGLEAPPPPQQIVVVKLTATRKTDATGNPVSIPDGAEYKPDQKPPTMTVAEYWCQEGCTVVKKGADLAVSSGTGSASPASVRAGQTTTFPTGGVVFNNIGDQPSGSYRVGYYIARATSAAGLPRTADGKIDTTRSGDAYARLLKQTSGSDATVNKASLAVSIADVVDALDLRIPSDVPVYDTNYGVCAYVDDQRVVSELNEENNIVCGTVFVQKPGYGFLGLQTPCSGMTCDKTGTLPLAWQFTNGSQPVDSITALPRLKFYSSCPTPAGTDGYPTGTPVATSDPNPATLSSGGSGWQYFANTGMSRPQWSWQLNFDATGLPRGTCYTMWIEIPSTGQVIGSTDPALRPFGPFFITPR